MQSPDVYLFPLDDIDPRDKGFDWLTGVGRAIDYKFQNNRMGISPIDVTRMQEIRNYSNGQQDASKYIDMWMQAGDEKTRNVIGSSPNNQKTVAQARGARKAYANLTWEIVSLAQTLKRSITSLVGTEGQHADVESLTKDSKNRKIIMKNKAFLKANLAPLMKEIGKPIKSDYFVPQNQVALEIYDMVGGFNLNFEITAKQIIEHGFKISNYHPTLENQLKEDEHDFNFICARVKTDDVSGAVKVEYCDPAKMVTPWLYESQGANAPFVGVYRSYSIPQLRDLLIAWYGDTPEVEKMVVEAASSAFQNIKQGSSHINDWSWYQRRDTTTNRFRYDEFFVDVLEFEYITRNREYYKKRVRPTGETTFYKDEFGRVDNTEKKKTVINDVHVIYEGYYIPSLNKACGGLQRNMMRKDKKTPCLSFVFVKVPGKAIGESLKPIWDMMMLSWTKLQAAIIAAKPKGIAIEIGSLSGLNIGGQVTAPTEVIKAYSQTGTLLYRAVMQQGKVIANGAPITELEGGIGKQLDEWVASINYCLNLAYTISGVTPTMGASPNISAEKSATATTAEQTATINNLAPLQRALEEMHRALSERILLKTMAVCKGDPKMKEYYSNIVGAKRIDELLISTGLTLDEMGIYVTPRVSELEKQGIMTSLLNAQGGGRDGVSLVDPSDDMFIRQLINAGRIEEATRYLQYIINEKKKQYSEESAAASQQQAQQLQQLEVTKMEAELTLEERKAQIELMKEAKLSALRVKEKVAIIASETEAEAYLLQVEAMVQLDTGKDTGTKIPIASQINQV